MKYLIVAAALAASIAPASAQQMPCVGINCPMPQMMPPPQPYHGQFYNYGGGIGGYQDNRGQNCTTVDVGGQIIVNCN